MIITNNGHPQRVLCYLKISIKYLYVISIYRDGMKRPRPGKRRYEKWLKSLVFYWMPTTT